jgi:hypothetical protein
MCKNTGTWWLDASWADPVTPLLKAAVARSKAKLLISTQIVFVPYIYIFSRYKISRNPLSAARHADGPLSDPVT